ncbi:TerC family protein [Scleromatobacter humisilvae]|uniref:TerC family protein n=1 Tax=Scleromatobacter humisilvae TaxID=2897159 RepID=A0A9X1YNU9_9BURK|nr:TerC family protein [Scleromatobacter humisilvae]MCK9689618.1 TerC family protein [Scleromatobacter humisilvae]
MDILLTTDFWAALGSIILANVLLSGDNAVVIAMAARGLPPHQQKRAIVFGSAAAIVMRIVLTLIAVRMLGLPWLKLVGGLALLWIGAKLMSDEEEQHGQDAQPIGVGAAVRTILVADLVMSLDNVLAVAAAAQGNTLLLIIGLAVSIPLIVFGSTLILKVMERFPVIITAGAALLGWLAGEMMLTDPAIHHWFAEVPESAVRIAGVIGAVLVVIVGKLLQWRAKGRG